MIAIQVCVSYRENFLTLSDVSEKKYYKWFSK